MSANIHPGIETDNWCRTTRGDTAKNSFSWTIEGFENRPEKCGESIDSAGFNVIGPNDMTTKWRLELFPKGYGYESENEVELHLGSLNDFKVRAAFSVWIVNCRKEKSQMRKFDALDFLVFKKAWGFCLDWDFNNDENLYLPDGNLTIYCEVTVYGPEQILSGSKFPEVTSSRRDNSRRQVSCQGINLSGYIVC